MKKPANKSSQPMPGGRRGFNRAPVARHGWPQRSLKMIAVRAPFV